MAQLPGRRPDLQAVAAVPQLDRQGREIRPVRDRIRDARHYKSQILPSNSDFDSVAIPDPLRVEFKDGGGNRNAAPLFVDPTHGDYREAEGSPTIDGGAPQEVGSLDLAGGPRIIGGAPDMGAFEFVPGPPPPPPAKTTGRLRALSLDPEKFHPFLPGHGGKPRRPRGTTVSYRLSAAGHVRFTVDEETVGRVVKGKCLRDDPLQ